MTEMETKTETETGTQIEGGKEENKDQMMTQLPRKTTSERPKATATATATGTKTKTNKERKRSFLDDNRILSIQSHVSSGYVGNRAATFPLQLLGYDVDVVNTVQFSNHTGYGHTDGHKTSAGELESVFNGLESNGLGRWRRVLSGYIPSAEGLEVVAKQVRKLNDNLRLYEASEEVRRDERQRRREQREKECGKHKQDGGGGENETEVTVTVKRKERTKENVIYLLDREL